ncbi:MAG: discoidin domain-containing protein, partial [Bacteroidota bacterium]
MKRLILLTVSLLNLVSYHWVHAANSDHLPKDTLDIKQTVIESSFLNASFDWINLSFNPSRSPLISQGKPSKQSSQYSANAGQASKAVDGNTSGNWRHGSVTHTGKQANPWWEVDLQAEYDIDRIEIFNRTDCCKERLDNMQIMVRSG